MVDDPEAVINRDGTFGQPEEIYPVTLAELNYIGMWSLNGPGFVAQAGD